MNYGIFHSKTHHFTIINKEEKNNAYPGPQIVWACDNVTVAILSHAKTKLDTETGFFNSDISDSTLNGLYLNKPDGLRIHEVYGELMISHTYTFTEAFF